MVLAHYTGCGDPMWHDPTRNLLVYETKSPQPLEFIPEAKKIDGEYVAVPITLENLQIMRLLGFPVIRPLDFYTWPRSVNALRTPENPDGEPYFGQKETANFFTVHPRSCCFSDMGAGKTLSCLWAADALMRYMDVVRGQRVRAIICAPLSTMQSVWLDAIQTHFLGRRKGVIVHGSEKERLAALARDVDFYITNHDGLKVGAKILRARPPRPPRIELLGFSGELAARKDINIAIVDEVGGFREARSDRSRVAKLIFAKRDYLWLLTGTPIPNSPLDAFGIAKLLNNAHGETLTSFRARTMTQVPGSRFKYVALRGANEKAMELMKPYIRFPVDLKVSLTIQNRDVPLTGEQLKWMRELKRELLVEMGKDKVRAVNSAALRSKLLQICCGAVYDDNHNAHLIDVRPRLAVLQQLIDENGKLLVFAPFSSAINLLNIGLKNCRKAVIVGETSLADRTRIMREFQQGDLDVILANAEPISRGQTLTAACVSVWWGPTDKCETYIQANKRIHRPGQTRPCTVVNLSGSMVEKETYRRLAAQENMQGLLLKLVEMGI